MLIKMHGKYAVVNVDCATDDELTDIASRIIPVHGEVARYAELKIAARAARLEGNIARAVFIEEKCEDLYNTMPAWARW